MGEAHDDFSVLYMHNKSLGDAWIKPRAQDQVNATKSSQLGFALLSI